MTRPPQARVYSEAERVAVAQAYIDALASHDAAAVRFAPKCTRVEAGLKTGFNGRQMRLDLEKGPQYRVIESISAPEFSVTGDEVRARFTLLTKPSVAGRRVAADVDETFLIPESDGQIHRIRARIRPRIVR